MRRSWPSRCCSVVGKKKIDNSEYSANYLSINTIKFSVCGVYIRVIWNVRSCGLAAAYQNSAPSATSVSRIEGH